jgi:hypothetical protein
MLGCVAMLAAAHAGRVGEDGSGAMWIAPELIPPKAVGEPCVHAVRPELRDLVFEVVREGDEAEEARLVRGWPRAVAFEWNETTSELSIAESSGPPIFDDLENAAVLRSPLQARSCGSP